MNKLLIIVAAMLCTSAVADPRVDHMVRECELPMGKDACRVQNNDRRDCGAAVDKTACRYAAFNRRYPQGVVIQDAGRFTATEYFRYVDADDAMCSLIPVDCLPNPDGPACRMPRALWKMAP